MKAKYFLGMRHSKLSRLIAALTFMVTFHADCAFADSLSARKELKQIGIEYTAQQFASSAGEGDISAVKLFLEAGMDINAGGSAALGLAAGRGRLDMVKFLLSNGAKPASNALQYARSRGHKEIATLLIEAGATD